MTVSDIYQINDAHRDEEWKVFKVQTVRFKSSSGGDGMNYVRLEIFSCAATLHVIMFIFCLFLCPIQIMDIQDLLNLNQTKPYTTKPN